MAGEFWLDDRQWAVIEPLLAMPPEKVEKVREPVWVASAAAATKMPNALLLVTEALIFPVELLMIPPEKVPTFAA